MSDSELQRLLGEVLGELKGINARIDSNHAAINQRIDDLKDSIDKQEQSLNQRIDEQQDEINRAHKRLDAIKVTDKGTTLKLGGGIAAVVSIASEIAKAIIEN